MWPNIGLNNAVIVVGGCDGGPLDDIDSGEDDEGIWKDGGVASGRVVNRIPVDTGDYVVRWRKHSRG